jgi:integrase/recombinase XerD
MLFSDALEMYRRYLQGIDRSQSTVSGYFLDLNFFLKWLEKKFNCSAYLEDVNLEDIDDFLKMLKSERNYKAASRRRVSTAIKLFYRFAYKKKLSTEDLASQIENIKVIPEERQYLTEREVFEFVDAVQHQLAKTCIWTMYYAGLRVSECINLKTENVDLEKKLLKVVKGKGNKDRTVPICDKLCEILKDYLTWRVDSTEYLFGTEKTGRISKVRLQSIIRETREKLGLKKKVSPHMFRHSFASKLVSKDVNIVYVSKLLGHSDVKVTSVYTHADVSQLHEAINQM